MECEGVKPALGQHCMKFHFPVKWESAEEWADLGPNPARAEWQPASSQNGGPSLCQSPLQDREMTGEGFASCFAHQRFKQAGIHNDRSSKPRVLIMYIYFSCTRFF